MSIRIVWNEHEQTVLLQALIDVLDHKTERKQAISEVSKRLRKKAESRGIEIDEKFRNENGISLQMNSSNMCTLVESRGCMLHVDGTLI